MSSLELYIEWRDNGVPSGVAVEDWTGILTDVFGFVYARDGEHGPIYKHEWLIKNRALNDGYALLTVSNHHKKQGQVYSHGIKRTINRVLKPMDDELRITAKLLGIDKD